MKIAVLCLLPLFVWNGGSALAQSTVSGKKAPCNCPKNEMTAEPPNRSFGFSNGKTIVVCGFEEPDETGKTSTFSEFVLAVCGQKTLIGTWDATKTCRLRATRDTLTVEEIETFASARPASYDPAVWAYEKLFFVNGALQRQRVPNRSLRQRYDPATIRQVLRAYETATAGTSERNVHLAAQLFVATLAGDAKARAYFLGFRKKFNIPDGEYAEQYNTMRTQLAFWDKQ
jgi:hypothetical protein